MASHFDAAEFGKMLYAQQEYSAAELIMHEYLKSNRQDEAALGLLGDIYEKMDRYDLAGQSFRSAKQLASAKGKDATVYGDSIRRVEAVLNNREAVLNNRSNQENTSTSDESPKMLRPSRRILPYFGFPETRHPRHTCNLYGFIINDGHQGMVMPYVPDPGSNEFIVGIFGGSIACDFYRTMVDLLAEKLADHPDIAGRSVTVLNFSMGGMKQPEQMIVLSYFTGIGQKFDMIIHMDGLNDLVGSAGNLCQGHHMAMPPADITNDFLAMAGIPQLSAGSMKYFLRLSRHDWWLNFAEQSSLPIPGRKLLINYLKLRRKVLISQKSKFDTGDNLIDIHRVETTNLPNMGDDELFGKIVTQIQEFWFNCVRNMIITCQGLDITYVHVLHPTHFLMKKPMGANDMKIVNSEPTLDYCRRIVGIGYPLMLESLEAISDTWSRAHNCNITNILEGLGDDLLTDSMGHFSPTAYRAMAENVTEYIGTKQL